MTLYSVSVVVTRELSKIRIRRLLSYSSTSRVGGRLSANIANLLCESKEQGTYKYEKVLQSSQGSMIKVEGRKIINLCSNNYLGFANHPMIQEAAINGLKNRGFGLASGRIICGTQDLHKQLERELAEFHEMEDCLLYTSCFDANAGVFEALLSENDRIFSDSLNHASIIDGIRLCKAIWKEKYKHADVNDLRDKLRLVTSNENGHEVNSDSVNLIVSDGIFSMDGDIAPLQDLVQLKKEYQDTYILIDDCHSSGVIGSGAADYCGVKVDIINGTLGKALGGASGGYTCAPSDVIEMLRQKSRPYVFSNSLAPSICAASICALNLIKTDKSFQQKLLENTLFIRRYLKEAGFHPLGAEVCPIIPVLVGDAMVAKEIAVKLFEQGILIVNLGYPIVPKNQARLRIQVSAIHTTQQLQFAMDIFKNVASDVMAK